MILKKRGGGGGEGGLGEYCTDGAQSKGMQEQVALYKYGGYLFPALMSMSVVVSACVGNLSLIQIEMLLDMLI